MDDVAAVEQAIAAVPAPPAPGNPGGGETAAKDGAGDAGNAGSGGNAGSTGAALDKVRDLVHVLDDKWRQRRQVISQAVRAAQPA